MRTTFLYAFAAVLTFTIAVLDIEHDLLLARIQIEQNRYATITALNITIETCYRND